MSEEYYVVPLNDNLNILGGSVSFDMDNSDLYIDHQGTFFNRNVTLSWKPVNDPQCNDFEIVSRTNCGQTSPIESMWHTNQRSVNLSSNSLRSRDNQERADFLIKATQNDLVCNTTKVTIQIQNSGKPLAVIACC